MAGYMKNSIKYMHSFFYSLINHKFSSYGLLTILGNMSSTSIIKQTDIHIHGELVFLTMRLQITLLFNDNKSHGF